VTHESDPKRELVSCPATINTPTSARKKADLTSMFVLAKMSDGINFLLKNHVYISNLVSEKCFANDTQIGNGFKRPCFYENFVLDQAFFRKIFDFSKNPRPRQIAPSLSTEMEQILMRTVEYRPDDRFRTAGDLRNELAIHLEKLLSGRVSYGMPGPQQPGAETVQVQTVYCGFCGGRIAADDVFCAHCGARQPLAGVGSSALLHASRPTAKLVVAGTTELDASFILQKDSNLLGRTDPHSNIFPEIDLSRFDPETKVSRRHARIWLEGDTFLVEDLGSVNGTVINDSVRLAPRQPRVLDSGDKLRVGETTLHFLVG